MHRRAFLGSAAATLALPGCATTMATRRATSSIGCLPPVLVSPERVIRTVAGLRPYRAAGFVVRAETLGDKRLVHNYGHGGAGITLSWGTSRLATLLGLHGHQGPVAVLGAGVMGLTTARLAQEAGFPVTLYAKALPPDTTSNIAGGQWSPFGHYRDSAVTPEWRAQFAAALDYSWRRFQIMIGDDYGIRWLPTYVDASDDEDDGPSPLDAYHPGRRVLAANEHPFALDRVVRFETMYVETGRFLRQLSRDVEAAGGTIRVREFATPADVAALPERLVFNCTGLGAGALFGDAGIQPVRGQLAILLPQPEVRYAFTGEAGYMFPRADGILLGGTFERGVWETNTEPEAIARILDRHQRLFGQFRCTA
ncbi:MAG TPA: FAD-dependent oxidoreductase [Allosphingosinicella sp.]|nr:FAD-dependent oxidoreductase [Allosphingosinicella sp.]